MIINEIISPQTVILHAFNYSEDNSQFASPMIAMQKIMSGPHIKQIHFRLALPFPC